MSYKYTEKFIRLLFAMKFFLKKSKESDLSQGIALFRIHHIMLILKC